MSGKKPKCYVFNKITALSFYQDLNDLLKNFQALVCRAWNYGTRSCDQTGAGPPTAHTELYSDPE